MMSNIIDESGSSRKAKLDEKSAVLIHLAMVMVTSRLSAGIPTKWLKQTKERTNESRIVPHAIEDVTLCDSL